MPNDTGRPRTKEECWSEFWDIIGPALVDLHREGKLPEDAVTPAA